MRVDLHKTTFSKEHYIEVIYILLKEKDNLYNKDIVEYMNLSKPSVSVAINRLIEANYIYREKRCIKLTDKGLKLGEELYKKHIFFCDLLIKIGVPKDKAIEEACGIEHIISNETFIKIKNFIKENNMII